MKIRVFDALPDHVLAELREIAQVVDAGWEFDIAVVRSATKVTRTFLDHAQNVKLVLRAGVGLDSIDLDACAARGVEVRNTAAASSTAVAELVFAHLLSIARKMGRSTEHMRNGRWVKEVGFELAGKTLGIVGYGCIGRAVADRARAFGMRVVAYDPFVEASDTLLLNFRELLHVSDIITLHVPLTDSTRNLINRDVIREMKDGVILVNTSRGDVVNEADLYDALTTGKISYAGLDVFQNEPTPSKQLMALDNVILTSHIGGNTVDAQDRIGAAVIEQVKGFVNTMPLTGHHDVQLSVITVSSEDRPGITAALTEILLKHNVPILDAQQATIQGLLALSFLVQIDSRSRHAVSAELLRKADEMELTLKILPFTQTRKRRAKTLYAVTCLTHVPRGDVLATVSQILSRHTANIETIRQFHGNDLVALELLIDVSATPDLERLKRTIMSAGETHRFDVALQKESVFRKSKRLIVFDMDSTLVDEEIIDAIGNVAGVRDELTAITEAANRGDMAFTRALRQRVALLKGVSIDALRYVASTVRLTRGARELITVLKQMGFTIALISGGFTFFTDRLKQELGLDYTFANTLIVQGKRLTGELEKPIIDGAEKANLLLQITKQERISLDQVVAVGNGANDIEMLSRAGLGIAYHPSSDMKDYVEGTIVHHNLKSILYMLGLNEEDVQRLR